MAATASSTLPVTLTLISGSATLNGTDLAGATAPSLTFGTATLADAGHYTITATNLAGTASASAMLTVRTAPIINTAPASRTVSAGDSVTFTVAVTAFPLPTCQ